MLSAGKAIQSPEELSLLVRVFLNTGHVREAKDLLIESKSLGPESGLFKLDHDLHRALQLEVLQASKEWHKVITMLRMAAKDSTPGTVQISTMLGVLFDACKEEEDLK